MESDRVLSTAGNREARDAASLSALLYVARLSYKGHINDLEG